MIGVFPLYFCVCVCAQVVVNNLFLYLIQANGTEQTFVCIIFLFQRQCPKMKYFVLFPLVDNKRVHCVGFLTGWFLFPMGHFLVHPPQWGAADAEIKVPSGENTELKRSPIKAWSKSVYSHTCYAYCQGFLACLFLHFRSIHLHFFQNLSRFFPVLAMANTWFLCRPAE